MAEFLKIKKVFSLVYRGEDMDYSVDFIGISEEECRQKLSNWLNGKETVRIRELENSENNVNVTPAAAIVASESVNVDGGTTAKTDKRGQHFIGTTWVVNFETKEKFRVPATELDTYLARGFVKGGPRTKVA